MDRTEVNASPVQRALQGIKKYKYVLLTALLGVLLLLLPQNEKAADSGSATPSAAENFDREALQNEMEDILSSLDGVGKLSLTKNSRRESLREFFCSARFRPPSCRKGYPPMQWYSIRVPANSFLS